MKLNNKGFSLIEILITVGLIGTLAGLAVPAYRQYQDRAKKGVAESIIYTAARSIDLARSVGDTPSADSVRATVKSKSKSITVAELVVEFDSSPSDGDFCIGTLKDPNSLDLTVLCGQSELSTAASCTGTPSGGSPPACSTYATQPTCVAITGCVWSRGSTFEIIENQTCGSGGVCS